jgi:hypothetical protein
MCTVRISVGILSLIVNCITKKKKIREVGGAKCKAKSVPLSVLMESARGQNGRSSAENAPSSSFF